MKKRKRVRFERCTLSIALAFFMVLGTLSAISVCFPIAAETSGFTENTKMYINSEKYSDFAKVGIKPVAQCLDSSGALLSEVSLTKEDSGLYSFTAQSGTTTVKILRKYTSVPEVSASVTSGCQRIFFRNTSSWESPYAYAWYMNGSSAVKLLGTWPGTAMNQVEATSIYYIDIPKAATTVIFSNNGGTQTDNLTLEADKDCYTHSSNLWSVYSVASTITVDVTARPNERANTFYVTGETTGKWSKYASPLSADMVDVYVKSAAWSSAYVTYDPSDPLSVVTKCQNVSHDGTASESATGYYKVQVPAGSDFIFKPNAGTDLAGSTAILKLPTGFAQPCYNVVSKTWQELSKVEDYNDYTVGENYPDNILGVSATYYDYLSDEELRGTWLNPIQAGTNNFSGATDNWFPFYTYNQKISSLAKNNSSWSTPLYFGNFCNTNGAYDSDHNSGGWANVTSDQNAYKFNYLANNSSGLKSHNHSYQGLVYEHLINNRLYVTDSLEAPYFNNEWLQSEGIAKVIKGTFPFTVVDNGTYKYYEFNSKDAEDNVYFTWATENGVSYPTTVNYGAGSSYGIDDGIKYFMNGGASGKGIFPFNNVNGTEGNKISNENKNYGFGIRMDIDFRVPENGLIPGTSTPVTFEFTGDDDLWVYVTDNETGESQLVLDMGGAHKESHGVINFNTKTATVDHVENNSNVVSYGYVYLSKDKTGWGDTYAHFSNDEGTVGEAWPGTKMSTYESSSNLRVQIPEGATKVVFNNNAGAQTAEIDLTSTKGAYWLTDTLDVNQWDKAPSDAGFVTGAAAKYFNFNNTDDQKTYTLSVFYMERGLIESNMKIAFTMTPLDNDLAVAKRVEADNVNPGLKDTLIENEKFSYLITDDGATVKNVSYSSNKNGNVNTDTRGAMTLTDSERGLFISQFETNSLMNFNESKVSNSGISYSANWKLSDNNTGDKIMNGATGEAEFNLINASGDEDLKTSLYLEYVNTPKTAPVTVTKSVIDESGMDISEASNAVFTYQAFVDIFEGNKFESFDLTYKLYDRDKALLGTYVAEDGVFSIKAGQRAVFEGIPVGAELKIIEDVKQGYELSGVKINGGSFADFAVVGGVELTVGTDNSVAFTNTYKPVGATLTAHKTLDNVNYTGTDFSFKCEGLDSMTIGGDKTLSTKFVNMTVSSCADGVVTFANTTYDAPFTYGESGIYCYKLSEVNNGSADIIFDDSVYYAKVVVTSDSTGKLSVAEPVYYSDADFTAEIDDADVVFANEIADCTVLIHKANFNNTRYLTGAQFKLVSAVLDTDGNWVQDTSPEALEFGPADVEEIEGASPAAVFNDVPRGDYLVIETKAPEGYDLSTTELHIYVERTAENKGVAEYVFTDLETGPLPLSGGQGAFFTVTIGVTLIGLGIGIYFLDKVSRKARKDNI